MPYGRIRKRELIIPDLRSAAATHGGEITMTNLIEVLADEFQPSSEDTAIIQGRADSKFSQKVCNLVSHRDTGTIMFTKGYATYTAQNKSIKVTALGQNFLDQVPEK